MSKYIDAEKLIAEIQRRKDKYDPHWTNAGRELEELISFTKSLQQEQPDGYNRAMLEVKAEVDKLYDETSFGLNEYDAGFYNGVIETCMKLRGFIKARTSQEQPEVDLEEEMENFARQYPMEDCGSYRNLMTLARHFYELGLNARKEGK